MAWWACAPLALCRSGGTVDAAVSKTVGSYIPCRFESGLRHHPWSFERLGSTGERRRQERTGRGPVWEPRSTLHGVSGDSYCSDRFGYSCPRSTMGLMGTIVSSRCVCKRHDPRSEVGADSLGRHSLGDSRIRTRHIGHVQWIDLSSTESCGDLHSVLVQWNPGLVLHGAQT